jgi:multisubunit Na+/H+ antiporter MnhE subunit
MITGMLLKIIYSVDFIFFYLRKLVKANLYIAFDILTPRMRTKPGFIEIDVKIQSNPGLLLFSNLLSMIPGTLVIDISRDKKTLMVHVLYKNNETEILKDIHKIQEKILRITG